MIRFALTEEGVIVIDEFHFVKIIHLGILRGRT